MPSTGIVTQRVLLFSPLRWTSGLELLTQTGGLHICGNVLWAQAYCARQYCHTRQLLHRFEFSRIVLFAMV